jgi:hypothetical protein
MSGINDFVVKFATVNGSGSASANAIYDLARSSGACLNHQNLYLG